MSISNNGDNSTYKTLMANFLRVLTRQFERDENIEKRAENLLYRYLVWETSGEYCLSVRYQRKWLITRIYLIMVLNFVNAVAQKLLGVIRAHVVKDSDNLITQIAYTFTSLHYDYPLDLPDVVHVLQALGFNLRSVDIVSPESITNGDKIPKGIRVTATCCHSGNRCNLDIALNKQDCKCRKLNSEEETYYRQVVEASNQQAPAENYLDLILIPPIASEYAKIIYTVINSLLHMTNYTAQWKSNSQGTSFDVPEMARSEVATPTIVVSPPQSVSPTRYRSLDTLTTYGVLLPLPGDLSGRRQYSTDPAIFAASRILGNEDVDGKDQKETKVLDLLKKACQILTTATTLYSRTVKDTTYAKKTQTPSKVLPARAFSSPNLTRVGSGTSNKFLQTKSKIRAKSTTSDDTSSKLKKTDSKSSLKRSNSGRDLKESKLNILSKKDQTTKRFTSLYEHVKSTIPKPGPSKKK